MALSQFIVYACPGGVLEEQIKAFYEKSLEVCGENAAHHYMPHCSLTSFFEDEEAAISLYVNALSQIYNTAKAIGLPLKIKVSELNFKPNWHGLELEEQGIKKLISTFSKIAPSPTRSEELRIKNWLHLSLAYEFTDQHCETLKQLAQTMINPQAPTHWDLRFYQKHPNGSWTCHQSWQLDH